MSWIWCNDGWLDGARFPGVAQDRGALLGLGLFETMLARHGRVVFADFHLTRFQESGKRLGWSLDFPDLREISAELLTRNGLDNGNARLRLTATAGRGPANDLTRGTDALMWLAAFPAVEISTAMSVCLSPWPRNERSPLAGLKTACYAENVFALDHARRLGFDETLILNTAGKLCEFATANLFLVRNGTVLTPSLDSGCLPGIGRQVILDLATGKERTLTMSDLDAADEIFLTSATRGPVPVVQFGERSFSPGKTTANLRAKWDAEISRA
jgi:branched-chain amino acid aminotransferase